MNKNEEVRMKKEEKRMSEDFGVAKISSRESKKLAFMKGCVFVPILLKK